MKLNKWLYGAAAALMLGACSDNLDGPKDPGTTAPETGGGYIGINIQMPTEKGTRANDSFNDGVASEYKLENATLVLFACDDADVKTGEGAAAVYDPTKDTPQNAKCIGAFTLQKSKDSADKDDTTGQITTQVTRFAKVTGTAISDEKNLYALVVANGDSYGLNPTDIEGVLKGKTIKNFQEYTTNSLLYKQDTPGVGYAKEIMMTNSPLSEYAGGNASPNTTAPNGNMPVLPVLVEIDPTTYPTEDEAVAHPAGIIHIERSVGKVTCSSFNKDTWVTVNVDGDTYLLVVDDIKWDLGNDLGKTYLVRNTNRKKVDASLKDNEYGNSEDMWKWSYLSAKLKNTDATYNTRYRMIGSIPITAGDKTFYRPYFCQVPGYNERLDDDRENKTFRDEYYSTDTKTRYMEYEHAVAWDANSAFYPHENTFPVEYQKYTNTTRIGFWVTFKFKKVTLNGVEANGKPITTDVVDDDGDPIYLDMTDDDNSFYIRGIDKSVIYTENPLNNMAYNYLKDLPDLKKVVTDNIKKKTTGASDEDVAGSYANLNLSDIIDIVYEEHRDADGQVEIKEVKFKALSAMKETVSDLFAEELVYAPFNKFQADGVTINPANTELIDNLNALEQVRKYKGGRAFYEARVKHFGEDQTPWNPDDYDKASTIVESYGTDVLARANNFLGRYGIVRNNWYDLNVSIIRRLGPPVDPAKWDDNWPKTPDDNKDEYISVKVRVLSWAKRTQNVEF